MTACSAEPVWAPGHRWECACGHVYDHSGRRALLVALAERHPNELAWLGTLAKDGD